MWTVYLSGEIHSDWRQQLADGAAIGKPYITLHDEDIVHALKEVDGPAMAWAKTPDQVVDILKYVMLTR
jgi:hypothetical protein